GADPRRPRRPPHRAVAVARIPLQPPRHRTWRFRRGCPRATAGQGPHARLARAVRPGCGGADAGTAGGGGTGLARRGSVGCFATGPALPSAPGLSISCTTCPERVAFLLHSRAFDLKFIATA